MLDYFFGSKKRHSYHDGTDISVQYDEGKKEDSTEHLNLECSHNAKDFLYDKDAESTRNVAELLEKYRERIDYLKAATKDVINPKEHDDIWLLRYCLSNPKNEKAETKIRYTIEYRKKNDHWLSRAKDGEEFAPHRETIKKYSCSTLHKEKVDGGPVLILRSGLANPKELMKEVSKEQLAEFLIFQDEIAYLKCDKITRETGILTKLLVINDMRGFSLMNNTKTFFDGLGISSKVSENIYPQLLHKSVAVNPILVYRVLLSLASFVVSEKTLAKFAYCKGDTLSGDISKCPFASKWLKKETTPSFLGGNCTCKEKGGCVDHIPNDAKRHPVWQSSSKEDN